MFLKIVVCLSALLAVTAAKVAPDVKCMPDQMRVEVPLSASTKAIYVQGLRDYPDPACRPHTDPKRALAVLELDLRDVYRCAVTRVVNKQTGKKIYYQTLVIESSEEIDGVKKETQDLLHVKCSMTPPKNHTIARRDVFPEFQEPENLTTADTVIKYAPPPNITVGVRQAGKLVTGELNVSPGTPLQMEISLDDASTPIYGLLVTHMQVSDTKTQEENIIFNGCSVDPYLFENFNTIDGDSLVAKFRAFKFPDSTYVQFKGTVNVCLSKCKGVECSDGQIGYGRRRRSVSTLPADSNKIFEITITSFIKVVNDADSDNMDIKEILTNQTKAYNNKKLIVGNQLTDDQRYYRTIDENSDLIQFKEEEKYTSTVAESAAQRLSGLQLTMLILALSKLFL